jgi:hypothetical protein
MQDGINISSSIFLFYVMVHIAVYVPQEVELGVPVQNRWLYPMEMTLGKHKRRVQNKAQPKASIAEAYLVDECLTFCSMYLRGIETRWSREERNVDDCLEETEPGRVLSMSSIVGCGKICDT